MRSATRYFLTISLTLIRNWVGAGSVAPKLAKISPKTGTTFTSRKMVMQMATVVTIVAICITIFLLVKVVPVFGDIFASFGATLPAPTQFLINVSDIVKKYLVALLIAGAGGVYAWLYFIKTPIGRQFWDARRIKLPVFGMIAHKICLARFSRTLASLIRSGVPILEVLQIVSQTVGNVIMEKAIKTAALDIERGEGISHALGKHPIFPSLIIRMITAGEQTGKIDNMLERISDFLDEEIETTLSGLTALIEPILIVFLGVVIGGMVICMFLPIFKMPEIVNLKR